MNGNTAGQETKTMQAKTASTYSKFTALPSWTRAVWNDGKVMNASDPFKWGGKNEPPAIGAKVKTYMNNLGDCTVTSYFVEHGWLGVLVQFDNPPEWYTKQNSGNVPGHVFGPELEPFTKP